jgi:hypothetical protein
MFIRKARQRYKMTGEPKVKKEAYTKKRRTPEEAMPIFSPR